MGALEDTLRRLALHDEELIKEMVASGVDAPDAIGLDAKTYALVRLSALIGLDAPVVAYQSAVAFAFAAGATPGDIVATLKAVAPMVGSPRVVAAAPALASAIGYDIDAALEDYDAAHHTP